MKILHTADWHVGRGIRGRGRGGEHEAVLAEIAGIAGEAEVDLVLVAGDVFDTYAPTPASERIVYRALMALASTGAQVVVVSGNHDNPYRLEAVAPLLDLTGVHCRALLERPEDGGLLALKTAGGETARVALLPFQSQRGIVRADDLMDPDKEAHHHAQTYDARCRRVLERLCAGFDDDSVNLVMAHLMVEGGQLGGGERGAHTVMDYVVSGHAFPADAHYVALGHVHRCQRVPAPCPAVWYSGSPLKLDFGEKDTDAPCSVLLVEASAGKPATVESVALSAGHRLRTIYGTLETLARRTDEVGDAYLRVIVESSARAGLADDVRDLFPNAVDVIVAGGEREAQTPERGPLNRLRDAPRELFNAYLKEQDIDDPRVVKLFQELLEEEYAPDPA